MYLKRYKVFFEGIRQDIGVVYHRTGRKALRYAFEKLNVSQDERNTYPVSEQELNDTIEKYLMPAIAKFGLMVSPGMYGPPAVYNTYSLKSQLNSRMESGYGEFIIKSQTKLSHVLIFDKDQAMRTFGPKKYLKYFKWIVSDRRVNVNFPTKDKRSSLDIIKETKQNNTNDQEVIKEMELMLIKKGAK